MLFHRAVWFDKVQVSGRKRIHTKKPPINIK